MPLVTKANWDEFLDWAEQQRVVAFDTETNGLRPFHGDRLVGISTGVRDATWYLPFRHEQGDNLPEEFLHWTIAWLNSRDQLIGHNSKFDLHMVMRDGFRLRPINRTDECWILDTLLGCHLVNENEQWGKGSYALKYLADKYGIGRGSKDEAELKDVVIRSFRKEMAAARKDGAELKQKDLEGMWKGFMWKLPAEQVSPYAEADALLTWGLLEYHVYPLLSAWGLTPLLHEVCQYNLLVTEMEEAGVKVDTALLDHHTKESTAAAKKAENALWFATGISNCNAAMQCIKYFEIPSTKEMELKHAVMEGKVDKDQADLLLDARGKRKVVDSYLVPYNRYLAADDAIHPSFKIHGTATGRLSCGDPNLMALPRDVDNQPAKAVFIARPGHRLVEIDLSQAELRVASHFAATIALDIPDADRYLDLEAGHHLSKMGAVLARPDSDLHTETMIKMQEINPEINRDIAKRANLSAIFGIGARKFSLHYAFPLHQAETALRAWRQVYPEFGLLYNIMEQTATRQGYIVLPISGRVRRYTYQGDNFPNKASSNLVQGTVADVMRHAMHLVHVLLETRDMGRILVQVHDSLLMEIRDNDWFDATIAMVRHYMTDFGFSPALRADVKVGDSWGSMKKYEVQTAVPV